MKNIKRLSLPVMAFFVMGFISCSSDDDAVRYSVNSLKNTELMNVLKSKGYMFDKDGKLDLNDLANKTASLDLSGSKLKDLTRTNKQFTCNLGRKERRRFLIYFTQQELQRNDIGITSEEYTEVPYLKMPKQISFFQIEHLDLFNGVNMLGRIINFPYTYQSN